LPFKTCAFDLLNNSITESTQIFNVSTNSITGKLITLPSSDVTKKYKVPYGQDITEANIDYFNYSSLDYSTITNSYSYDTFGNLTNQTNNISNGLEITTIDYSNFNSNGSFMPNKPETEVKSITRAGNPTITKENHYEYFLNGAIKKEILDANLPKKLIKEYQYFPSGLPNQEKALCEDGSFAPKIATYLYDAKHRAAVQSTIQGVAEVNQFNFKYGLKTKQTNDIGLTSEYTFSDFGIENKAKNYLGKESNKVKYWVDQTNWPSATVLSNDVPPLYFIKSWGENLAEEKTAD
jgi:hypothetical protein